jgi:hypothetical protein
LWPAANGKASKTAKGPGREHIEAARAQLVASTVPAPRGGGSRGTLRRRATKCTTVPVCSQWHTLRQ